MSSSRTVSGRRAPLLLPIGLALCASSVLAALNISSARAMAPSWGQDLAFFTQIVHSAAHGGPWASPLLMEPQGFFAMVHTHLVLPLVVATYALVQRQEVLLAWQGLFAGLTLWPAYRLAETCALERRLSRPWLLATLAALSILLLGPFQATGTCDFRPSVLFMPGVVGVFAAARVRQPVAAVAWGLVALSGRQEASYLLVASGAALCLLPWGPWGTEGAWWRRAWAAVPCRVGLAVVLLGVLSFGLWVLVKPAMFFHFDPTSIAPAAQLDPGHRAARVGFALRALRSGLPLALLDPAGLLAGLPLGLQLARDHREWTELVGATAHYHAPWLAFVLASTMAGVCRWPRRLGGAWVGVALLLVGNGLAWAPPGPRRGPVELMVLVQRVPADARVAADYDTIHALAGREILWNTAQLHGAEDQRPYAWDRAWPLTLRDVDAVLTTLDDPALAYAAGWIEAGRVDHGGRTHVLLLRP